MSCTVERHYTLTEMMIVGAARRVRNGSTCFIGIGTPGLAGCLAQRRHAPDVVLAYESGILGAKPSYPPPSIADNELAATADFIVSVPEMFNYWLQGGRIETAILGAAQIDRLANLNTTVIGEYARPRLRLPGAGGAPEIARNVREVVVVLPHSRRAFVERLDFRTTPGDRVSAVITDMGVLEPDPETRELVLISAHRGIGVPEILAATGWPLRVADGIGETPEPDAADLDCLRALTR